MDDRLRDELVRMAREDQEMLRQGAWDIQRHLRHVGRLKEIVALHGWPTREFAGVEGAHAAWLLAQHADEDIAFQKQSLGLLERAVKAGTASAEDLAYLTDRVLANAGKPQLYGTQFFLDKKREYGPWPVADAALLDERRRQAGLEPFAEYQRRMRKTAK